MHTNDNDVVFSFYDTGSRLFQFLDVRICKKDRPAGRAAAYPIIPTADKPVSAWMPIRDM